MVFCAMKRRVERKKLVLLLSANGVAVLLDRVSVALDFLGVLRKHTFKRNSTHEN